MSPFKLPKTVTGEDPVPARLFMVRNRENGVVHGAVAGDHWVVQYFASKMEAKRVRDELGGDWVVTHGPDHKDFKAPSAAMRRRWAGGK